MNLSMRTGCVVNVKRLFLQIFWANFKHCARAGICHGIATKFQPGGRTETSSRAEIRHVIGP